jgi:hypothetical protein
LHGFAGAKGMLATAGEIRLEVVGADEILDVQEGGTLEADVHEGCLQTRQDARYLAQVNVAYCAAAGLRTPPFDVQLGDNAALDEGDAGLCDVAGNNEDILGHSGASFPARGCRSLADFAHTKAP